MTPANDKNERAHFDRLRELQRRYDCADNVGNEEGCRQIQGLIDAENARWAAVQEGAKS